VLVRVHAVSVAADLLGVGGSGERSSLVQKSMELIAREGRGVVVLIRDLRPHSVSEWIGTSSPDPRAGRSAERRLVEIGIGSQILRDLGVREMILLSNQPQSRYVGLEGYGLSIVDKRRIE
jgi:3,4-dihydroxy 2-butanone 4-phosphate synthase/GTP cyclohydrolase II